MIENVKEFIDALMSNPSVIAIASTVVGLVTANAATIILFIVKMISMKKNEIKNREENARVIEALNAKYNGRLTELEKKLDDKLDKVERAVLDKVQELDTAREQLITDESVSIQAALAEAKAALSRE